MSSAQTAQKASVDPKAFAKHLETLRGQWDVRISSVAAVLSSGPIRARLRPRIQSHSHRSCS